MTRGTDSTRVEVEPRAVAGFTAHYGDSFRISRGPGATEPRAWAQMALRGTGDANGAFSRLVWEGLLGFDLAAPGTPGTLQGWRVTTDDQTSFVMAADGSRMAGQMVFSVAGDAVTWTTLLRFHDLPGRLVWSIAGHAHRAIAPRCLDRARRAQDRKSVV